MLQRLVKNKIKIRTNKSADKLYPTIDVTIAGPYHKNSYRLINRLDQLDLTAKNNIVDPQP